MEEIGSASVPVLVSVTAFAAEVPPTACTPKASELGASVYNGTMPVPDSATVFVPAPPPPVTVSVPLFAPALVGLNATVIVQLAPAATEVPQVWLTTN